MRLHQEGWRFLLPTAALLAVFIWFIPQLAIFPLAFLILVLIFFRNPTRVTAAAPGEVVAPADGYIIEVVENELPPIRSEPDDDQRYIRISIFLSLMNVHVTRAPATGQVGRIEYKPGKFFHAATRRGIEQNETNSIEIIDSSNRFFVVQSTGALARRIICGVSTGENINIGQEIGFIRFGSRVDLYVPMNSKVLVKPDQKVVGAITPLCSIN